MKEKTEEKIKKDNYIKDQKKHRRNSNESKTEDIFKKTF